MTKLRLFHVVSSSSFGGAERCVVTLLKGLANRSVDLTIACHRSGPMIDEYRAHAARVWPLDLSGIFDPRTVMRLSALMRDAEADIVHTHLWNADVLGGTAALQARIPAVSTVYGAYHLPIEVGGFRGLRRRVLSRSYRAIYRCFDRVMSMSNYIVDDMADRPGIRVRRRDFELVPPVFDLDRIPMKAASSPPERPRSGNIQQIATVGSFFPVKGQEWLLRAMPTVIASLPNTRCVFVGDGPDRLRLEGLAAELGLGKSVRFAGAASDEDMFRLVSNSDVLVQPSVSEGVIPQAILEAWAMGLPVVASEVGAIPEAIDDETNGLLVPPRDPQALAGAVTRILSDSALARRLATAGREIALKRYSSGVLAERTIAIYKQLLEARRRDR